MGNTEATDKHMKNLAETPGCLFYGIAFLLPPIGVWWAYKMPQSEKRWRHRLGIATLWLVFFMGTSLNAYFERQSQTPEATAPEAAPAIVAETMTEMASPAEDGASALPEPAAPDAVPPISSEPQPMETSPMEPESAEALKDDEPSPPAVPKEEPAWYDGGDLHRATLAEWIAATEHNRLATAGDFVAKLSKLDDLEKLRTMAERLMACLDEASAGAGKENDDKAVSEIAATCYILLFESGNP